MKFTLPIPPDDGILHVYCITCNADGVKKTKEGSRVIFVCPNGHRNERALYYGGVKFWLDEDKELWHETIGVFVRNPEGKYFFFDRTEYPFGIAIPAGHVDEGETPLQAAKRELEEETGLHAEHLHQIFTTDIHGDSCSGGSDIHRWHAYLLETDKRPRVNHEGKHPVWLTLEEAKTHPSPFPIQYVLEHYTEEIEKAKQENT